MSRMNRMTRWVPALVLLSLSVVALATPTVQMVRQVTGGGGGQLIRSGISLQSTVGQIAVGINSTGPSGNIELRSGYWQSLDNVSAAPESVIPARPAIYGNAPNPFNPLTEIRYSVGRTAQPVRLRIYDVQGHLVRTLVDQINAPGVHTAVWQGRNDQGGHVSSGMYFCRLQVGAEAFTHKMMLLK